MVLLLTDFNDQQKIDRYLYLLNLLDFIMDNSTLVLHTKIASKNFMSSLLRLLKLNERPEIQRKTLVLIEKLGIRFEKQKDILPNFSEIYKSLKESGIVFPLDKVIKSKSDNENIIHSSEEENDKEFDYTGNNYGDIKLDLNPDDYPLYDDYVQELQNVLDFIMLLNEMIDNSEEANKSMLELLNECFNYTKMIQDKLIVIQEEKLLCISMGINEDLQKTIERYQQLGGHIKPSPFVSSFKNEYKEYNTYVPKYKVKIELKKEQQLNQPLISSFENLLLEGLSFVFSQILLKFLLCHSDAY